MQSYGAQSRKSPNFGNFKTPTWESRDKKPFGYGPYGQPQSILKGEGGGFPQVWAVVSFVSLSLPMACPSTKSAQTMH